jgi:aldehyde:ferredoxin oxidoreductase
VTRRINLNTGTLKSSSIDDVLLQDYVGGLGLAVRLMADTADPALSPLDPANPLIISLGSLNNTGFPGANRTCFFGLSPLTGFFAGSWLGGNFGTALARSGTMALVLEGKVPEPSIVIVREDATEVVPRPDLWGLTVSETKTALRRDYGNMRVAIIGPAGERMVRMACVCGDEGHSAGRCGMGAILGSKNVKAILADGRAKPVVAEPDALRAVNRKAMEAIRTSGFLKEVHGPMGTANLVKMVNEFEAPEYETLCMFGSDNGVDDYPLIVRANALCNDLGLDTISTGNAVVFYREFTQTMHDASNVLDLLQKMATRQGEGDLLAKGTREAAEFLHVDSAMQVKGLELPGYDPRKLTGMAISYCTANRGGCHSRSWTVADEVSGKDFSAEELARMVARYHDKGCVRDSLIVCTFLDGTVQPFYADALTSVLGEEYDDERLSLIGERIYTLERQLNVHRGVNASLDVLPHRLVEELVSPEKFHGGMRFYYQLRNWDGEGRPKAEKLEALGLGFIV